MAELREYRFEQEPYDKERKRRLCGRVYNHPHIAAGDLCYMGKIVQFDVDTKTITDYSGTKYKLVKPLGGDDESVCREILSMSTGEIA